jgi:hypothetical protein
LKKKNVSEEKKEGFRQKITCNALKIKDLERNRRIPLEKLSLQLSSIVIFIYLLHSQTKKTTSYTNKESMR